MNSANYSHLLSETELTDDKVVQHVLSGDKECFEIILRRYNQRLFRVIRSYIPSEDDARDILQDTYIKAFMKLPQFSNRCSFSTWLIRIAINEALQYLRKKKRPITWAGIDALYHLRDNNPISPKIQMIASETLSFVEKAVDQLPEKYKVVFVLHGAEGMSDHEIAMCLQITERNVKERLHRAKNLLKEALFNITQEHLYS